VRGGRFLMAEVWDLVWDMQPISPGNVAYALDVSLECACKCLQYMGRKGYLVRIGKTHRVKYYIHPEASRPTNKQGTDPNSRANLDSSHAMPHVIEARMRTLRKWHQRGQIGQESH
jgi:hypothetical protein